MVMKLGQSAIFLAIAECVVLGSAGCATFSSRGVAIGESGVSYESPAFTPDGKTLVFRSQALQVAQVDGAGGDVLASATDGSGLRRFVGTAAIGKLFLTPDGRFVLFTSFRDAQTDIYRLDLTSGESTNLTKTPSPETLLQISRDGREVLLVSRQADQSKLERLDLVTGERKPLTTSAEHEDRALFSPDGKHVAVRRVIHPVFSPPIPGEGPDPTGSRSIKSCEKMLLVVVDFETGNEEVLASTAYLSPILWAPDSERLLYQDTTKWDIRVVSLRDKDARIVKSGGYSVAWSGDGLGILYLPQNRGSDWAEKPSEVRYIALDGSREYTVISDTDFSGMNSAWDRSFGHLAVFVRPAPLAGSPANSGIMILGRSAGVVSDRRQWGPMCFYSGLIWSPDGTQLAYSRRVAGGDPATGGIFVMPVAGGAPRQVIANQIQWRAK